MAERFPPSLTLRCPARKTFLRCLAQALFPLILLVCPLLLAHGQPAPPQQKIAFDGKFKKSCTDPACHPKPEAGAMPLHVPYLEEQCGACHTDHTSQAKNLLREGGNKLCLNCHDKTETGPDSHILHPGVPADAGPEAKKGCTECHSPHGSRIRNLLRDEKILAFCSECHSKFLASGQTYPHTHGFFNPKQQCGFCHYAHQNSANGFLRENVGESCLTCHDLPIRIKDRNLENIGEELRSAKVVHGSMREGSCPKCHTPHGSIQSSLLKEGYPAGSYAKYDSSQYALCWQCHSSKLAESLDGTRATGFRNGTTNLHRLHLAQLGRGRACHLCHAAHASDQPHLLKDEVIFNQWKAPLKYRILPKGGGCTTACHREKTYQR